MRGDEGRFPVGALITIAVVAAAGFGAYWLLGEMGFLGATQAQVTTSASPGAHEDDDDPRPEWLQDTEYALPAAVEPEDERMPVARTLEPWVWDQVDEDWDLSVIRVGEGDQYTWFSDVQELYLISPTEDYFKVSEFDTTVNRDVVHWDPELTVAWIRRADGSQWEQVIEFDLRTQENTYDFAGTALSTANRVDRGIANLNYLGVQPDGQETWVTYDGTGATTGVAWRDGTQWRASLVRDDIRKAVLQAYSQDRGLPAWFDVDTGRAVYHGVYTAAAGGVDGSTESATPTADHLWLVHDMVADTVTKATVAVPSDDCGPLGGGHAGLFDGDRIVAMCDGEEWLLDPYAGGEPQRR